MAGWTEQHTPAGWPTLSEGGLTIEPRVELDPSITNPPPNANRPPPPARRLNQGSRSLAWVCLALCLSGCAATRQIGSQELIAHEVSSVPRVAVGDENRGPWWTQMTAMGPGGKLDLKGQSWWERAAKLKVGEQFTVAVPGKRPDLMLIRREKVRNTRGETEALVWVIDDNEDGSLATGGDKKDDCYVVDYGCDGTVDRIVDYIEGTDGRPDEMDIRYFEGGELRSVWVGVDLDRDGKMWDLAGYEYSHNFFKSDPYGNEMIYMNKYDPTSGQWVPISECPFAFYDTDGDGYSEVVIRVSAAPLQFNAGTDPDYANDAGRYRGKWSDEMSRMGAVNVRYSFDIDNLSSKEYPLHYDYGFNLVGTVPYDVPRRAEGFNLIGAVTVGIEGVEHFNPRRRPPQVTKVIPHNRLRAFCDTYPARETGFTWHEGHDDTIAIGDAPDPKLDFRWEGVFWIWERRFMSNTGGPGQKWNVRREWTDKPASRRELYYSEVDRRIHLFGAKEGWIEIGNFAGLGRAGEIRMFDTDSNGIFDRWEVYTSDSPLPVRVTTVKDERARRIPFEDAFLHRFYTQEVLPQAMAANERLMAAMAKVRPFEVPAGLAAAMKDGPDNYRRYAQDVAREMEYQDLRRQLTEAANGVLREAKKDDLRPLNAEQRKSGRNSATAWRLATTLEKLDVAYGQGEYDKAEQALAEVTRIEETVK